MWFSILGLPAPTAEYPAGKKKEAPKKAEGPKFKERSPKTGKKSETRKNNKCVLGCLYLKALNSEKRQIAITCFKTFR